MSKYVFIGSEAEGYYSGAYECVGVVVPLETYKKYENVLDGVFEGKYFHELDGKHSEVKGSVVTKFLDNLSDVVAFVSEDVDLDVDVFSDYLYEYIEDGEFSEEDEKVITDIAKATHKKINELESEYEHLNFYLTKEDATKVKEFVESLNTK